MVRPSRERSLLLAASRGLSAGVLGRIQKSRPMSPTDKYRQMLGIEPIRARDALRLPRILRNERIAGNTDLILRSLQSKRLEGWPQGMDSWPSFETRARRAPQDEAGDTLTSF